MSLGSPRRRAVGTVKVRGQVARPRSFTMARLRSLPQHTVRVRYQTSHGAEKHTFTGPLLSDVLQLAEPRIDPDVKNAQLRLVVTGDVKGGRHVSGVVRLHVGDTDALDPA
ncbi:molybdopterin-dependent oxidoreductase [Nonomuraea angiospora]